MQGNKINIEFDYELITCDQNLVQRQMGSFGWVQLARCKKTGEIVGIKKINSKMSTNELQGYRNLDHKNLVKLIKYYLDQKNGCIYMVIEYPENGNLMSFIRSNGIKDRSIIYEIMKIICSAVDYALSRQMSYFDLHPQNIFINKLNNVKICCFKSRQGLDKKPFTLPQFQYTAPEFILGRQLSSKSISWTIGIIFYQLIQGHTPFKGLSVHDLLNQMQKKIHFTSNFRNDQIQLIKSLLKFNSLERLEPHQALKSELLTSRNYYSEASKRTTADSDTFSVLNESRMKITQSRKNFENQPKIKLVELTHKKEQKINLVGTKSSMTAQPKIKILQISEIMEEECPQEEIKSQKGASNSNSNSNSNSSSIQITSIKSLNEGTQAISIFDKLREQKKPFIFTGHSKQKISLKRDIKKR